MSKLSHFKIQDALAIALLLAASTAASQQVCQPGQFLDPNRSQCEDCPDPASMDSEEEKEFLRDFCVRNPVCCKTGSVHDDEVTSLLGDTDAENLVTSLLGHASTKTTTTTTATKTYDVSTLSAKVNQSGFHLPVLIAVFILLAIVVSVALVLLLRFLLQRREPDEKDVEEGSHDNLVANGSTNGGAERESVEHDNPPPLPERTRPLTAVDRLVYGPGGSPIRVGISAGGSSTRTDYIYDVPV